MMTHLGDTGVYSKEVYHREADDTYWQVSYRMSTDGETNELRDGLAPIVSVYPHEIKTTVYKPEPQ